MDDETTETKYDCYQSPFYLKETDRGKFRIVQYFTYSQKGAMGHFSDDPALETGRDIIEIPTRGILIAFLHDPKSKEWFEAGINHLRRYCSVAMADFFTTENLAGYDQMSIPTEQGFFGIVHPRLFRKLVDD